MGGKLTTLANVKQWLNIVGVDEDDTSQDVLLNRAIVAASRFVETYLSRVIAATSYVENFRGNGKDTMLLRNFPVISVSGLTGVRGSSIGPATGNPLANGYVIGDDHRDANQSLELIGFGYPMGARISVTYTAGYQTTEQTEVVASTAFVPVDEQWIQNDGVRYAADNTLLLPVKTTPLVGQYTVSDSGSYGWSTAEPVGTLLNVTYSFVPADLEQAVIDLVSQWFKRRDHIGYLSKSLGGQETVSFSRTDMTDTMKEVLNSYMSVIPL